LCAACASGDAGAVGQPCPTCRRVIDEHQRVY
jgi:hypothetical protein